MILVVQRGRTMKPTAAMWDLHNAVPQSLKNNALLPRSRLCVPTFIA
jgi:hypothetical protein